MKQQFSCFVKSLTVTAALLAVILFIFCILTAHFTPSEISVNAQKTEFINGTFPFSLKYDKHHAVHAVIDYSADNSTTADLMLFDAIPIKTVTVNVTEKPNVIVGGMPFGIRIYTDGLVVSGTSFVQTAHGSQNPSDTAGIESGDIILSVNGEKMYTNEQLLTAVETSHGNPLALEIMHDNQKYSTEILPVYDNAHGKYRIGLMVRDSCAGIGTMTFIDPYTNTFGGLGHGICDANSGSIMPLESGDIVQADIISVTKSVCGNPGALTGSFTGNTPIGTITANSDTGVYGTLSHVDQSQTTIPVAFKQEVQRGAAQILTTIDGSRPQYYDIQIEDVSYNNANVSKNMTIRITDKHLLEKTGGIVQGMSGSPIIQNGQLIGAVTHVFVNDPTGGFAVFAENMIDFNSTIIQNQINSAA